ncbi:hypothetical protein Tco_0712328 [Tanacetum coccineum]
MYFFTARSESSTTPASSYGITGIFACLKGASIVRFQDINAKNKRYTTIPNVLVDLEQARDRQSLEVPLLHQGKCFLLRLTSMLENGKSFQESSAMMVVSRDKTLPRGGDKGGFQEVGCGRGLMRQTLEKDTTSY